ncbi:MAG: hypothetical protein ACLGIF_05460, partial [Actinomycetes bacterium]
MGARWRHTAYGLVLALALALGGCTYAREEPGLFRRPPAPAPTVPVQPRPLEPANPDLPVAAETEWTSGEGLAVKTRFAVHAVRRMDRATVLDWSVTPLAGRGLHTGDDLPGGADLGLNRVSGGDVSILLLDSASERIWRPLSHRERSAFRHCLCSPLWVAQQTLRIGETRLLQLTFPALPADVRHVDVALVNSVPFRRVPVTPEGQVPTVGTPSDLTRPASVPDREGPTTVFPTFLGSRQRLQGIQVTAVVRSPRWTALAWTLVSVTDQPNLALLTADPPVTAHLPPGVFATSTAAASGPQLRPAGERGATPLRARYLTT